MAQQIWATNSLGGYLTNNRLSKTIREQAQPLYTFRQFCSVKEGGSHKGDTVYFDKTMSFDTAGGTLTETATVPANLVKVIKGSCTVTEYGNGIGYTQKLDTLAEWDVQNIYQKWLVNDQKKVIDSAVAATMITTDWRAVCTTTASTVFTTNSSVAATASCNMSDKNVMDIVDYMKKGWIPKYGGGKDYVCIASVNSMRGVYTYLQALMAYTTPEFMYSSEVGRFYNTRFIEDDSYLSNAIGSGTAFGSALFLGDEAVMEAVALPEEVRYQELDMGRDKKLAWYGIMGWAKMWDMSTDDLNTVGKGFERIVYVTSA